MDWIKYQIECDGIINSLKGVTNDPYVIGYLEILKNSIINKEINLTNKISARLIEWYKVHIDYLLKDQFVYDKDNQKKTYQLLINLYEESLSIRQ